MPLDVRFVVKKIIIAFMILLIVQDYFHNFLLIIQYGKVNSTFPRLEADITDQKDLNTLYSIMFRKIGKN